MQSTGNIAKEKHWRGARAHPGALHGGRRASGNDGDGLDLGTLLLRHEAELELGPKKVALNGHTSQHGSVLLSAAIRQKYKGKG